jgi:hypothetical protein
MTKATSQFDARTAAAEAVDEYPPFVFTGLDGETYELPHPGMLETGQALATQNAESESELFKVLEQLAPTAVEAIKAMPAVVTAKLMEAWYEEAGDEGKSLGPRSVPNRAARRSKPTSRSEAST